MLCGIPYHRLCPCNAWIDKAAFMLVIWSDKVNKCCLLSLFVRQQTFMSNIELMFLFIWQPINQVFLAFTSRPAAPSLHGCFCAFWQERNLISQDFFWYKLIRNCTIFKDALSYYVAFLSIRHWPVQKWCKIPHPSIHQQWMC